MLIKTTKADFRLFKKTFTEWQRKLSLGNYRVYFIHTKLDDEYAQIITGMAVASVSFSTLWDDGRPKTDQEIRNCALHECLHLLLGNYQELAYSRFTTGRNIQQEDEEVVRRLEKVIGGKYGDF